MTKFDWRKVRHTRNIAKSVDYRTKKGKLHLCRRCSRPIFSPYRKYCDACLSSIRIHTI